MAQINARSVDEPIHTGDVIIKNVCNTGINVIAASDLFDLLEEA
jgi:CxxC motif-containing protein